MAIRPEPKKKPWQEERKVHQRLVDNSKFYNSRTWRKFRKARLMEQPLCVECDSRGEVVQANVLDHIIRIEDGGAELSVENTQPLCSRCHNSKSGREGHGWKARRNNKTKG